MMKGIRGLLEKDFDCFSDRVVIFLKISVCSIVFYTYRKRQRFSLQCISHLF